MKPRTTNLAIILEEGREKLEETGMEKARKVHPMTYIGARLANNVSDMVICAVDSQYANNRVTNALNLADDGNPLHALLAPMLKSLANSGITEKIASEVVRCSSQTLIALIAFMHENKIEFNRTMSQEAFNQLVAYTGELTEDSDLRLFVVYGQSLVSELAILDRDSTNTVFSEIEEDATVYFYKTIAYLDAFLQLQKIDLSAVMNRLETFYTGLELVNRPDTPPEPRNNDNPFTRGGSFSARFGFPHIDPDFLNGIDGDGDDDESNLDEDEGDGYGF